MAVVGNVGLVSTAVVGNDGLVLTAVVSNVGLVSTAAVGNDGLFFDSSCWQCWVWSGQQLLAR